MEWKYLKTLIGDHPRIIPVNFGEIPPNSLGGYVIYLKEIVGG